MYIHCSLSLTLSPIRLALYSTHDEGETFPRNHRSQPDSSLEKWQNVKINHARSNSDFIVLDAWMSILLNFRIRFHQYLIYHSCSISVSLNNQMMKLIVNIIRNINVTSTIKSLLGRTRPQC